MKVNKNVLCSQDLQVKEAYCYQLGLMYSGFDYLMLHKQYAVHVENQEDHLCEREKSG